MGKFIDSIISDHTELFGITVGIELGALVAYIIHSM